MVALPGIGLLWPHLGAMPWGSAQGRVPGGPSLAHEAAVRGGGLVIHSSVDKSDYRDFEHR